MLTASGALLVAASIDLRAWGTRGQLVAAIGAAGEGGAPVGYRGLAEHAGVPERYAHRVLGELVVQRVVVQVEGAGRRPSCWWLRADVRSWVAVPWRVPVESVELRLFHVEPGDGATSGFAPRSYVASLARVEPRSYVAALGSVVPRSRVAAQASVPRRALDRGTTGPRRLGSSPTGGVVGVDPSFSLSAEEREGVQQAMRAVLRHTGGWGVTGAPLGNLTAAVREHGSEAVLRAIGHAPDGLQVPRLCAWLVQRAGDFTAAEAPPEGPPAPADPGTFYTAPEAPPEEALPTEEVARRLRETAAMVGRRVDVG